MELEFSGDQEDDGLDGCETREPARTALGCLEQAVDGLQKSMGLARLGLGHDALQMGADHLGDLLHFEDRGETNVFHQFYSALVQQLYDAGVSRNVYCVNIDAVIAALLLKMLWKPLQAGEIGERELETAAFTIFLYPRMLGCAAEIDDHLNRGRNMDTRTVASSCKFGA